MELLVFLIVLVLLILSIAKFRLSPFLALLFWGLVYGILSGINPAQALTVLLDGFAQTLRWIAVIMIFGTLIGEILNETGHSKQIADSTLKSFGERKLPAAMGVTGFIISIPVFVDVAYIMMQSVTEALTFKSRRNILSVGLSLVAGLTATHALMPPTPGPLAVAGILNAELGIVILVNFVVALFAMAAGLAWAVFYCRRIKLAYDDKIQNQYAGGPDKNKEGKQNNFLISILPILVPLILIGISSFIPAETDNRLWRILAFVGEPFVALAIGVLLALFQFGKNFQMRRFTKLTEKSIEKAALVIMITAAGGAFGHIIQESGIVDKISGFTQYAGNLGFLFPFLLAALFTTTTGSLTVSMITTASVVMPLLPALNMSPQLAAALIGSGSFCVFHVNSSFFWLLNRLHDVPSGILLKTFTVQSLCMGLGGLFSAILMRIIGVL